MTNFSPIRTWAMGSRSVWSFPYRWRGPRHLISATWGWGIARLGSYSQQLPTLRTATLGKSIFIGKQECGRGAISLGDEPKSISGGRGVAAEDSKAVCNGILILGNILGTEISPIAGHVPLEKFRGRLFCSQKCR
jgi:hypothetical protein